MEQQKGGWEDIDAYIGSFPPETQAILNQLRAVIRAAAPDAVEKISYQMPTYFLNENLVHFAAYRHHVGFYPTPSGITAVRDELAPYAWSKGAVQFPIEAPLPWALIDRMVRFRVEEARARPRRGRTSSASRTPRSKGPPPRG